MFEILIILIIVNISNNVIISQHLKIILIFETLKLFLDSLNSNVFSNL